LSSNDENSSSIRIRSTGDEGADT